MKTHIVTLTLVVRAKDHTEAEGIGRAAADHLLETFNDDGSLLSAQEDTDEELVRWTSGLGCVDLRFYRSMVNGACASGPNDDAVAAVCDTALVGQQLDAQDPDDIRAELRELGGWSKAELADDAQNRQRLVWTALWDLYDERN